METRMPEKVGFTSEASFYAMRDMASPSTALARNWWVIGLRGAAAVLFGVLALVMPVPTLSTLLLIFAAYLVVDGVASIWSAMSAAMQHRRWGLLVIEGILDLALAALALFAPIATIFGFVYFVAAWALVTGVMLVIGAVELADGYGRFWMGLAGLLSAAWGVCLFARPAAGALILTWWLAGYALLFGAALIALSLKLRRRHGESGADLERDEFASAHSSHSKLLF